MTEDFITRYAASVTLAAFTAFVIVYTFLFTFFIQPVVLLTQPETRPLVFQDFAFPALLFVLFTTASFITYVLSCRTDRTSLLGFDDTDKAGWVFIGLTLVPGAPFYTVSALRQLVQVLRS